MEAMKRMEDAFRAASASSYDPYVGERLDYDPDEVERVENLLLKQKKDRAQKWLEGEKAKIPIRCFEHLPDGTTRELQRIES